MPYTRGAQTLVHVVQNLSSTRSLEEVMKLVRTAAREIAQADGATFVLKDGHFCYYADEDAISPLWKGQRFPMSSCVSGWTMMNKKPVIIEDIYADSRVPVDAYRPTFVQSLTMTPIRRHDPIGAIGTYWKEKHRPTPEQMEMLQALADTTSVAMENVSLYNTLQTRIEELKTVNEAKNEFLMTLSHELRTPLNSIVGWSEILNSSQELEDDVRRRGIGVIYKNAKAQAQVIDDLLDASQIVSGKFELSQRRVDLNQVLSLVIDSLESEVRSKQIRIDYVNPMSNAFVYGDPLRLEQIIRNLLKNAIQFSYPQGQIQIFVGRAGPHFQIQVVDHGEGIALEILDGVFDIFKQGDSSITRKHSGLGLGLYIARYLAEAHHGHISAYSAGLNQGSTFKVLIPAMSA